MSCDIQIRETTVLDRHEPMIAIFEMQADENLPRNSGQLTLSHALGEIIKKYHVAKWNVLCDHLHYDRYKVLYQ